MRANSMKPGGSLQTSLGRTVACAVVGSALLVGCNRNKQEAILLANQADNLRQGDKPAAIEKLDEATRLDPDNHHIWFKLASVYEDKEDWQKMAEALQSAISADERVKEDGDWASYHAKRGFALEKIALAKKEPKARTDAYEEAKAPYTKCIELDENYADCYHHLGHVYLWTDDEQKALQFFTDAIAHDPDAVRYYPPLAELYINLFMEDVAMKVLQEGKSRAKPSTNDKREARGMFYIHIMLADLLQRNGDYPTAAAELESAKAIDLGTDAEENVNILYNLGVVYAQTNQIQKAIENLKGFAVRCKGQVAARFPEECDNTTTLLAKHNAPQ